MELTTYLRFFLYANDLSEVHFLCIPKTNFLGIICWKKRNLTTVVVAYLCFEIEMP